VQVTAMIAPDNVASVSVALRLGMRPERDEQLDGKPVRVYTLHRDAWPPPEGPARPA
jgi:RimJ/RimL family protein N-acetyltransferase